MDRNKQIRSLAKYESFAKRIIRIKVELISTDEGSRATDFRHNRVVWTKFCCLDNLDRHRAAENTLNCDFLIEL